LKIAYCRRRVSQRPCTRKNAGGTTLWGRAKRQVKRTHRSTEEGFWWQKKTGGRSGSRPISKTKTSTFKWKGKELGAFLWEVWEFGWGCEKRLGGAIALG